MPETTHRGARRGRDVIWRMTEGAGMEYARLEFIGPQPNLSGRIVTVDANEPVFVSYRVDCDPAWKTRVVIVRVVRASQPDRQVRLESDGNGSWSVSMALEEHGATSPVDVIDGCLDVDLAFSPVTNTLPIRRLGLPVGASIQTTSAWLQFPSLELTTLPQSYTRTDRSTYRYESFQHQFVAVLETDDLGLVTTYEYLWEQLAVTDFGVLSEHDRIWQET